MTISIQGPTNNLLGSAPELKPIFQLPCFCAHLGLCEVGHKSGKQVTRYYYVLNCSEKVPQKNLGALYQTTWKAKFYFFPQIVSKQVPI